MVIYYKLGIDIHNNNDFEDLISISPMIIFSIHPSVLNNILMTFKIYFYLSISYKGYLNR